MLNFFRPVERFLIHVICFLVLTSISLCARAQSIQSIEQRRHDYQNIRQSRFSLLPHKPMYLMPFVYNWVPHEDIYDEVKKVDDKGDGDFYKKNEAEFQISFSIPVVKDIGDRKWDLMFAYTHHAYWQVYNSDWSRPFRETNYMPEFFSRYVYSETKKLWGVELHALDVGYVHQSNGQIQVLSRSWNRLFVRSFIEGYGVRALVTGWYRFKEKKDQDDNRDIHNFMGYGEVELIKSAKKHTFHFKMPLFANHPSYDFKYSYPLNDGIRWFINYQSGYGHSLIEYNRFTQRIGAGFLLDSILY